MLLASKILAEPATAQQQKVNWRQPIIPCLKHKIISWPAAALKLAVQQGFPDQQLKHYSTRAGQQNSSWTLLLHSSSQLVTPATYTMIEPEP